MGAKIIDQYTNRTDLTAIQKHYLRHPEAKEKNRIASRMWTDLNRENVEAAQARWKAKRNREKVESQREGAKHILTSRGVNNCRKRKEVIELHSRGKDLGMIAVWTRVPVSVVKQIITDSQSVIDNHKPSV